MGPQRIQRERTRGTIYGNPFVVRPDQPIGRKLGASYICVPTREAAVAAYRDHLNEPEQAGLVASIKANLRGKDLCCWCPVLGSDGNRAPCHADELLRIANAD